MFQAPPCKVRAGLLAEAPLRGNWEAGAVPDDGSHLAALLRALGFGIWVAL